MYALEEFKVSPQGFLEEFARRWHEDLTHVRKDFIYDPKDLTDSVISSEIIVMQIIYAYKL